MSKAYSSNLTLEQWELLEPLIPPPKSGGRPREVEVWNVLNAIFYLLTQGCTWRNLPGDFPAWQTVYRYFRTWRKDGTWLRLHDRLKAWVRVATDRSASPTDTRLWIVKALKARRWSIKRWDMIQGNRSRDANAF